MDSESTTQRVLRLLGLLQRRPSWTAAELAAEMAVTDRTVRRDVERLRSLGYPVRATAGVGGGYQLGAGTRMPPLLLDDQETIAVALALRLAAGGTVAGAEQAGLSALAKLEQMMPPRLRTEAAALQSATRRLPSPAAQISTEMLVTLAHACREQLRTHFHYSTGDGAQTRRTAEPVQMVTTGHRWYLMAYDLDRADWRTFRLDRMSQVAATTFRFRQRDHPDPTEFVQQAVSAAPYRYVARMRLRATVDAVAALVPPQVARVQDDDGDWCLLTAGADDLDWLAMHVAGLGFEAEVLEPAELRGAAAELAERLHTMAQR